MSHIFLAVLSFCFTLPSFAVELDSRELIASCHRGTSAGISVNVYDSKGVFVVEITGLSAQKKAIKMKRRGQGFYDIYYSEKPKVELAIMGDDMGAMSTLTVGRARYDLTCAYW